MDLQLDLRAVRRFLVASAVVLVVAHLLLWVPDLPSMWWANLDGEDGVNNWYALALWLVAAAVAAVAAWQPGRARGERTAWLVMAGLFVLFSLDEEITAHEHLSVRVEQVLHLGGAFRYGLPLVALALVPVVVVALVAVSRHLPKPVARLILVAAGLYVVAQAGFEELEGWASGHAWAGLYADGFSWQFRLLTPLQESLELAASSLLVYAGLLRLALDRHTQRIRVVDGPAARPAPLRSVRSQAL